MSYIYPKPGVANVEVTLNIAIESDNDAGLDIPALQDVTVQADTDVFTWEQLDASSKQQIATTSTNALTTNIVVDQASFFGDANATTTAAQAGIFGLSNDKTLVKFTLFLGETSEGVAGKTIEGNAYITGLSPTVSASSPVWVSPLTLTVDGEYTVS